MPEAIEALKRERNIWEKNHERYGEIWTETWKSQSEARDLVFPYENGTPMNRNNILRHFRPLAGEVDLPKKACLYTLGWASPGKTVLPGFR